MASSAYFGMAERACGLLVVVIGTVAFLVKAGLLPAGINFSLPAPLVHAWPWTLIVAGVVLLWIERKATRDSSADNGERK